MWKKATVLALALVFVLGLTAQAVMGVARTRYTDNSVDEHSRTGHQYTLGGRTRAASVEASGLVSTGSAGGFGSDIREKLSLP